MLPKQFTKQLKSVKSVLAEHSLSVVAPADATVPTFLVHKKGTSDFHYYVIIAPSNIGLTGDFTVGGLHGVWSVSPYGLDWFSSLKDPEYLCSKFLVKEYDPELTAESFMDFYVSLKTGSDKYIMFIEEYINYINPSTTECMYTRLPDDEIRKGLNSICDSNEAHSFIDTNNELFDEDFEPLQSYGRDAARLVGIQQTFVNLYEKHQKSSRTKKETKWQLPKK